MICILNDLKSKLYISMRCKVLVSDSKIEKTIDSITQLKQKRYKRIRHHRDIRKYRTVAKIWQRHLAHVNWHSVADGKIQGHLADSLLIL